MPGYQVPSPSRSSPAGSRSSSARKADLRTWRISSSPKKFKKHFRAMTSRWVSDEVRTRRRGSHVKAEYLAEGQLRDDYQPMELLGRGSFSRVMRVVHRQTGIQRAAKVILKNEQQLSAVKDAALNAEIEVLSRIKHPNVLRIYEVYESRAEVCLVLEFAAGGLLLDYLGRAGHPPQGSNSGRAACPPRSLLSHVSMSTASASVVRASRCDGSGSVSEADVASIVRQLMGAVAYLHSHGIVHGNLRLDSVLLSSMRTLEVKIGDFGLARVGGAGSFKSRHSPLPPRNPRATPSSNNSGSDVVRKHSEVCAARALTQCILRAFHCSDRLALLLLVSCAGYVRAAGAARGLPWAAASRLYRAICRNDVPSA